MSERADSAQVRLRAAVGSDRAHRALFSPCRNYRYALWRYWGSASGSTQGQALFVGLNPSTADATNDDPTLRRCIGFAQAWGYDGLCLANLFAYRARLPGVMKAAADPVGPDNDRILRTLAAAAGVIVAAWGAHGAHQGRADAVRKLLPDLHCLRLTKAGQPGHPLYLPASLRPVPWPARN